MYALLQSKNELNLIHGQDINLKLHNCTYSQLVEFEQLVQKKASEYKNKASPSPEKRTVGISKHVHTKKNLKRSKVVKAVKKEASLKE